MTFKPRPNLLLLAPLLFSGCIIHLSSDDFEWDDDDRSSSRWIHRTHRHQATEMRALDAFGSLSVEGAMDVLVRVGAPQSIWLRGPQDDLPHVEARVEDGQLILAPDELAQSEGHYLDEVQVEVGAPSLRAASLVGTGSLTVEGAEADLFVISLVGTGDIDVQGDVAEVVVDLTGTGDIELFDLDCDRARVNLSGTGDVHVAPRSSLDVRVVGSGDVVFRGSPEISARVQGTGAVEHD